jgi:cytochrome P450
MKSFFVAMLLYPDIQMKAQEELDSVIGRDRLPTFEDRPRLPFVEAVCKEALRWRVIAPLSGFPQLLLRVTSDQRHFYIILTCRCSTCSHAR